MFDSKWLWGAIGAASLGVAGVVGAGLVRQDAAPAPAEGATTDADPALWVVKDDNTTVYLFGTVHVLRPGLSWFDEAVKTAFDESDQVVLELIMPDDATAQAAVLKHGVDPSGTPLTQELPEDARAAYVKSLTDAGMPANAFDQFHPWFAATNLSIVTLMKAGYDPNSGAEKIITDAANKAGKKLIGLETMDQQLGFFSGLSQQSQMALLTSTVEQLPEAEKMTDEMVADWAAGDPQGLAELLNESLRETPELSKVLLADRNARWAEWIDTRLDQPGTVFVAVGAGHLAGADSVQAMLAKRDITAERIDY